MAEWLHPDRRLEIEGTRNVRDLGGYTTKDGRSTRWRRFIRADNMVGLSISSQTALLDYGVKTIVDLRRTSETEKTPNVFEDANKAVYHHLPLRVDGDPPVEPLPEDAERFEKMAHSYSANLDAFQDRVKSILLALSNSEQGALYHCRVGKDRTGMISALLLSLAGVPDDTVAEDYALSARYLFEYDPEDPDVKTWEDYRRLYSSPKTMLLVLDHLNRTYGSVEAYVRGTGLSDEPIVKLRESFLA